MSSELDISQFLQFFSPISLHHRGSESLFGPWVFWSESEGCENNSSLADAGTPMFHHNIKSALSYLTIYPLFLAQFWAPVTIDSKRLLSASDQPFSVCVLNNDVAMYRLHSEKCKYNIDANKLHIEPEHMILSGGPATAFLNCWTSIDKPQGFLLELNDELISVMVPICFPSQSNCIGVLQFTLDLSEFHLASFVFDIVEGIKRAGLDVFYVQRLIPYKAISGLEVTKDEIEEALKVVCQSHDLALAQVWIPYEDKNNVPFSYSLEDTRTKLLSAIKLTGYLYAEPRSIFDNHFNSCQTYYSLCDVVPSEWELTRQTLKDYESRFISKLHSDSLVDWEENFVKVSALVICLRSIDTGDVDFAFEFFWFKRLNTKIILEAILLTLKRLLPRFKYASGRELDDELDVIVVQNTTDDEGSEVSETKKIKIFQEKRSSPSSMPKSPGKGKNQMVVDLIAPSKVRCKTTPIVLTREVIEEQFGNTMKEAKKNLNVSISTLKRKCKEHGILEWRGPNFVKRNQNDSSVIQINTNEEDNGAIEGISTLNLNKDVVTLKADYSKKIIKLHLAMSQTTFVAVEKEIGMKLKLSVGTFELEYIDEDKEWISLTSDGDMNDCIKSSRKRMRVLPSPQPISGTIFG